MPIFKSFWRNTTTSTSALKKGADTQGCQVTHNRVVPEICKLMVTPGYKSIQGSAPSEQTCPVSQRPLESSYSSRSGEYMVGTSALAGLICEHSSPDPQTKLLSRISALYPLILLSVKAVLLEPGESHHASQHRQATKVVQGNRKAGVHFTHPKLSYSLLLLSTGISGS